MNSNFCQQRYRVGEVVYDIGSNPDLFYILLSGNLTMETEIIIDEQNRFPVVSYKTSIYHFNVINTVL